MSEPGSPTEQRSGKRKWIRASIIVLILIAAWTGYLHFRNRLALVSGKNKSIRILAREAFGSKPFIDTKLPIVGQITFPEKGDLPTSYVDSAGVSGLLLVDFAALDLDWETARPTWDFGQDGAAKLMSDGDELSMYYGSQLIIRCPFVFGSVPRVATISLNEDTKCEVKIPASGTPEPTIKGFGGEVGPWKFKLDPQPWISPSFKLRFKFTLEGKDPTALRFVEIWGQPDLHAAFQIHEGESKEFAIENWSTRQDLLIRVWGVVEEPVKVLTKSDPKDFSVYYADGEAAYSAGNSAWSPRHLALRIGQYIMNGAQFFTASDPTQNPFASKRGKVFDATGYRAVSSGRADVTLELPEYRSYPRTSPRSGDFSVTGH